MKPAEANFSIADRKSYLPAIDGLRGIAILMVLAVHTGLAVSSGHTVPFHLSYFQKLVDAGARGVQLFFMISAFTLFSSSYRRFQVDLLPKTSFYLRRFFRILPFWWLIIVVIACYRGLHLSQMVPSFFFYFGFLRFDSFYNVNQEGWSLFVEETFYLFLPAVFAYVSSLRRAALFIAVTLAVSFSWLTYAPAFGVPVTNSFVYLFPLTQWYCFAVGIFIFYLRKEGRLAGAVSGRRVYLLDALALELLATLVHRNIYVASFALMVFFIVALDGRSLSAKLVSNPLLMRFGGCCYSIYLFHTLLLGVLSSRISSLLRLLGLQDAPVDLKFLVVFPAVACLALLIGMASFRFIEKPSVELGKRVIARLNEARAAGRATLAPEGTL